MSAPDGTRARILVVEDEGIVAMDLAATLERMGYQVAATTGTGEEAIELAMREPLDLILMDIHLGGAIDGIDAATTILKDQEIPIVYLTAYTDEETLRRAKITGPYGYAVKPYEERELRSAIEIALYKHGMERRLRESEGRLDSILRSIGDAVVATDPDHRITFINQAAAHLFGVDPAAVKQRPVVQTIQITDEGGRNIALRFEPVAHRIDGIVTTIAGREVPIEGQVSPIRSERDPLGWVLVFRDMTAHRLGEAALRELASIITSTDVGIFTLDMNGHIKTWNQACERLMDIPASQAIECRLEDLFTNDTDDLPPEIRSALKDGRSWSMTDRKVTTPKGTTRRLGIHVSPQNDPTGRPIGASIILNEVERENQVRGTDAVRRRLLQRARKLI